MARQYNMPGAKESENFSSPKLYKPLPDKHGEKKANEVFITLSNPSRWKLFNPSPEAAQIFGYVQSPNPVAMPEGINTYHFKFPVHRVPNFQRQDGSTGFTYVICPDALNKYMKQWNFGSLFTAPHCAFCEKEQRWWQAHNDRWAQLGYSGEAKWALDKGVYRNMVESDVVLQNTRTVARKYSVGDRYMINVFDHAKFIGKRPYDEGQTTVEHQIWFAPKAIYAKLENIFDTSSDAINAGTDIPFFEVNPQGCYIIAIIKDTTQCKANDLRDTKYDALRQGKYQYSPEWCAYLDNLDAMVDPSDFLTLARYEDAKAHLDSEGSDPPSQTSYSIPQTQAQTNQFTPSVPQPQNPQPTPQAPREYSAPGQAQFTPSVPQPAQQQPAPAQYAPPQTPQTPQALQTPQAPQALPQQVAPQTAMPQTAATPQQATPPTMNPPQGAQGSPPIPPQAAAPQRTVQTIPAVQGDSQLPPSFGTPQEAASVPPATTQADIMPPTTGAAAHPLPNRQPPADAPVPGTRHRW